MGRKFRKVAYWKVACNRLHTKSQNRIRVQSIARKSYSFALQDYRHDTRLNLLVDRPEAMAAS